MDSTPAPQDVLTIEQHGEVMLIVAAATLETLDPGLIEQAAHILLEPIRRQDLPLVVIDLEQVDFFGSSFLALLLRCWKLVMVRGGQMVLAGVSERARELLRITSLDMIWPIYASRREAIDALQAD
jgi:anti-sigma B factor antagonist